MEAIKKNLGEINLTMKMTLIRTKWKKKKKIYVANAESQDKGCINLDVEQQEANKIFYASQWGQQ